MLVKLTTIQKPFLKIKLNHMSSFNQFNLNPTNSEKQFADITMMIRTKHLILIGPVALLLLHTIWLIQTLFTCGTLASFLSVQVVRMNYRQEVEKKIRSRLRKTIKKPFFFSIKLAMKFLLRKSTTPSIMFFNYFRRFFMIKRVIEGRHTDQII